MSSNLKKPHRIYQGDLAFIRQALVLAFPESAHDEAELHQVMLMIEVLRTYDDQTEQTAH